MRFGADNRDYVGDAFGREKKSSAIGAIGKTWGSAIICQQQPSLTSIIMWARRNLRPIFVALVDLAYFDQTVVCKQLGFGYIFAISLDFLNRGHHAGACSSGYGRCAATDYGEHSRVSSEMNGRGRGGTRATHGSTRAQGYCDPSPSDTQCPSLWRVPRFEFQAFTFLPIQRVPSPHAQLGRD